MRIFPLHHLFNITQGSMGNVAGPLDDFFYLKINFYFFQHHVVSISILVLPGLTLFLDSSLCIYVIIDLYLSCKRLR